MIHKANIIITDGTREHVSLFTRQYAGEPWRFGTDLLDYVYQQTLDTKHGSRRLKSWTALTANLPTKISGIDKEQTFEPLADCSYLYILNTSTQELSGFWCMTHHIPAEQYLLMVEERPRMAHCIARGFNVPFKTTNDTFFETLNEKKRLVKAKHEKLMDMRELKKFNGEIFPFTMYLADIIPNIS